MAGLSARTRFLAWLLLAGAGLALFFTGEYRDIQFPAGWLGTVLFVAAVWFPVDSLARFPHGEHEARIAPGEWLAWVGVAFLGAVMVALVLSLDAFDADLPLRHNPEAGRAGRHIGTLFVAWLVLAQVLRQRWAGKVLEDERDAQVKAAAGAWARAVTALGVVAVAILLGFSDPVRLQALGYPVLGTLLVLALLAGAWVEELAAALLYWRDRRASE